MKKDLGEVGLVWGGLFHEVKLFSMERVSLFSLREFFQNWCFNEWSVFIVLLLLGGYEASLRKEGPVVIYCGGFMQFVRKGFSEEGMGGGELEIEGKRGVKAVMNDVLNQALGIYRVEMGQRKTDFYENFYGNDKLFIYLSY